MTVVISLSSILSSSDIRIINALLLFSKIRYISIYIMGTEANYISLAYSITGMGWIHSVEIFQSELGDNR